MLWISCAILLIVHIYGTLPTCQEHFLCICVALEHFLCITFIYIISFNPLNNRFDKHFYHLHNWSLWESSNLLKVAQLPHDRAISDPRMLANPRVPVLYITPPHPQCLTSWSSVSISWTPSKARAEVGVLKELVFFATLLHFTCSEFQLHPRHCAKSFHIMLPERWLKLRNNQCMTPHLADIPN